MSLKLVQTQIALDCVPCSLATYFGISYKKAVKIAKRHGYVEGKGFFRRRYAQDSSTIGLSTLLTEFIDPEKQRICYGILGLMYCHASR